MRREQLPEIFVGFKESPCSFAILIDTGWKSSRKDAQHSGRPHTPSPPTILALSRTPICRNSMRMRNTDAKSLDEVAEIHTAVRREEKQKLAAVERVLRVNELHVKLVRGDLLLADGKGVLCALYVPFGCGKILLRRHAQNLAQRLDSSASSTVRFSSHTSHSSTPRAVSTTTRSPFWNFSPAGSK